MTIEQSVAIVFVLVLPLLGATFAEKDENVQVLLENRLKGPELHHLHQTSQDVVDSSAKEDKDQADLSDDKEREPRQLPGTVSTTYTRWGRKVCPNGAELVYDGEMAGSLHGRSGGGSDYLCLPIVPQYGSTVAGAQSNRDHLYGVEYETSGLNSAFDAVDQYDAPCAVCRVVNRGSSIMVPGWRSCPPGWDREYSGYLMSAKYYTHQYASSSEFRTQHICVDEEPQSVFWTSASTNGASLYFVEARCTAGGGIPCGPYIDGNELTCAVCTV